MSTITIPKEITQCGELVILPRREYDALRGRASVSEFTPTATQKRALAQAESNFRRGRTLSYDEFAHALGGAR